MEVNGIAGSSNPAYTIANENMMTVTFQVSEAVKNTLTMGQEVTVERGNASYTGNITEIGVASEPADRSVPDQSSGKCRWQCIAQRCIRETDDRYLSYERQCVLIPYDAVYYDNTGSYVYLSVDGKAVKTYVTTDLFDDTQISVTEGIQPGDTVITSWSPKLMNGVEVTAPVKAEE